MLRKVFKGGKYSRAETIWGNTVPKLVKDIFTYKMNNFMDNFPLVFWTSGRDDRRYTLRSSGVYPRFVRKKAMCHIPGRGIPTILKVDTFFMWFFFSIIFFFQIKEKRKYEQTRQITYDIWFTQTFSQCFSVTYLFFFKITLQEAEVWIS